MGFISQTPKKQRRWWETQTFKQVSDFIKSKNFRLRWNTFMFLKRCSCLCFASKRSGGNNQRKRGTGGGGHGFKGFLAITKETIEPIKITILGHCIYIYYTNHLDLEKCFSHWKKANERPEGRWKRLFFPSRMLLQSGDKLQGCPVTARYGVVVNSTLSIPKKRLTHSHTAPSSLRNLFPEGCTKGVFVKWQVALMSGHAGTFLNPVAGITALVPPRVTATNWAAVVHFGCQKKTFVGKNALCLSVPLGKHQSGQARLKGVRERLPLRDGLWVRSRRSCSCCGFCRARHASVRWCCRSASGVR